jgi:hypothetical protein
MSCSSKPWLEIALYGKTVAALKIYPFTQESHQNQLIVVTMEGDFYIFNIFE